MSIMSQCKYQNYVVVLQSYEADEVSNHCIQSKFQDIHGSDSLPVVVIQSFESKVADIKLEGTVNSSFVVCVNHPFIFTVSSEA